jgi:pimeloyl-ACP methyl ester carboxylesterase
MQVRIPTQAAVLVALLVGAAAVGAVAVSHEAADRLVHPPRDHRPGTPMDRGVAFERTSFVTTDGLRLVGWWMPASAPLGTVVFLHGYGASKAQSLSVAPFLHEAGFNVLAFDFRAHGDSEGDHTTVGLDEAMDVEAAVAWLRERSDVNMSRVALFGWSMGAAAALNAAHTIPEVRAVVADSAFANLDGVLTRNLASLIHLPPFPFVPLTMLFMTDMTKRSPADDSPERSAGLLDRPLLLIFGAKDTLSDADADGASLEKAAGAHGELWVVPEAGHTGARLATPSEYESRVVAFLHAALGDPT